VTCTKPSNTTGYVIPEGFACTSDACDANQITCAAEGYRGTPVIECTSGDFVLSGCNQVGDCCPDKSDGSFICDTFGATNLNNQTCVQLAAAIAADPAQTECPQMIYDLCPFSCGKCDCCSNDFSKCDVEGAADGGDNPAATCAVVSAQNNGAACNDQLIADNCPGSCEPQGACGTTTPEPSDVVPANCCSSDPEICDTEGPISTLAGNTCDYIKDQLASNGMQGCPVSNIWENCPKMCEKCDCCANDLTKCDTEADANVSCQQAYDLSNGAACGAIGEKCPKTCGLCSIAGTI
jgi:hypothetical protein